MIIQFSDLILALAKVTGLLLVIFALAPLFKNPTHRARLLTLTFFAIPLLFLLSFTTPILKLIPKASTSPHNLPSQISEPLTTGFIPSVIERAPSFAPAVDPSPPSQPRSTSRQTQKTSSVTPSQPPAPPFPWVPVLFAIGALLTFIPFLISSIKILLLPQSKALDPPLSLWKKIHQSGHKTPQLSFTPAPAAPFTHGLIRPRVLLPDDSPSWTTRRLRSTLLHEAAHLQRRDPLVRFFATLVRAVFWFHPLVWIAHHQLIAAQEQACDQAALNHGLRPDDYAEELLASATLSHLTPTQALSMARWSQLGNRIRHILEAPKPTSMKTITLTSALALITTLAFASIGFSEEASTTKTSEAGTNSTRNRGAILDRNDKPLAIDDENGLRTYPTGKSTGNIVGYVGKANRKDPVPSQGKSGVEKSGDAQLAKKEDVKLTIDADLQKHCYDLLAAQEHAGSVVVQDPLTGELLALVSYPSFDPNLFIPAITSENYKMIRDDKKNPLLDKSINGSFAPGSVVKPLVALAGEFAGLNNPEIHCKNFMEFGRTKMHDWNSKRDELLRIPEALETSCNTYFMELAIRTGEKPLNQIGEIFHLNEAPLTSLTSSRGHWNQVPKGENVSRTSLALTSLGQGRTLLSPLHVSTMTSAIASGAWHQPFLIQGQTPSKPSTPLIGQGQITADSLNTIREGMRLSIHGKRGTAQRATIPGVNLAGKTGTAQFKRSYPTTNCWFTGYGPYEEPKYAVTVLLSGATSGGKYAAPVAKEVFDYLLSEK